MSHSLRGAINAKCKDCLYDPECGGGTWREQIAKCSSISCPLWSVRPLPGSGPLADAQTDPATLPQGWLTRRVDSPEWGIREGTAP